MKKSLLLSIVATKVAIVFFALLIILGAAVFAESILSGAWLWAAISALIIGGAIKMLSRISKTKNFKIINRLEGPSSLGEEMK